MGLLGEEQQAVKASSSLVSKLVAGLRHHNCGRCSTASETCPLARSPLHQHCHPTYRHSCSQALSNFNPRLPLSDEEWVQHSLEEHADVVSDLASTSWRWAAHLPGQPRCPFNCGMKIDDASEKPFLDRTALYQHHLVEHHLLELQYSQLLTQYASRIAVHKDACPFPGCKHSVTDLVLKKIAKAQACLHPSWQPVGSHNLTAHSTCQMGIPQPKVLIKGPEQERMCLSAWQEHLSSDCHVSSLIEYAKQTLNRARRVCGHSGRLFKCWWPDCEVHVGSVVHMMAHQAHFHHQAAMQEDWLETEGDQGCSGGPQIICPFPHCAFTCRVGSSMAKHTQRQHSRVLQLTAKHLALYACTSACSQSGTSKQDIKASQHGGGTACQQPSPGPTAAACSAEAGNTVGRAEDSKQPDAGKGVASVVQACDAGPAVPGSPRCKAEPGLQSASPLASAAVATSAPSPCSSERKDTTCGRPIPDVKGSQPHECFGLTSETRTSQKDGSSGDARQIPGGASCVQDPKNKPESDQCAKSPTQQGSHPVSAWMAAGEQDSSYAVTRGSSCSVQAQEQASAKTTKCETPPPKLTCKANPKPSTGMVRCPILYDSCVSVDPSLGLSASTTQPFKLLTLSGLPLLDVGLLPHLPSPLVRSKLLHEEQQHPHDMEEHLAHHHVEHLAHHHVELAAACAAYAVGCASHTPACASSRCLFGPACSGPVLPRSLMECTTPQESQQCVEDLAEHLLDLHTPQLLNTYHLACLMGSSAACGKEGHLQCPFNCQPDNPTAPNNHAGAASQYPGLVETVFGPGSRRVEQANRCAATCCVGHTGQPGCCTGFADGAAVMLHIMQHHPFEMQKLVGHAQNAFRRAI